MPDGLRLALAFLTRLPTPAARDCSARAQGRAVVFYPLVGAIIGLCLAALGFGVRGLDPSLAAALNVLLWVLITGALHLDGLADSADAWLGGGDDRARSLSIMKDPVSGPAGVVSIVVVLLLKFAALSALVAAGDTDVLLWALLWVPTVARCAVAWLLISTPYVRADGLGAEAARHAPRAGVWAGLTLVVPGAWLFGPGGAWVVLTGLLLVVSLRLLMMRRLGGTTGDTAGALVEIVEAGALAATVTWVATR
ncbi:MAG: adenosylcobinamide-GDP ribazoletransferase [Gammaproteobacteria bacterium]